ncbi:MAG: sensor histidine kinase KdpD [Sporomusaceae bacterium]|nr:sensor histidine kinase KdpD [Sporomusaceae bacterium]
MPTSKRRDDRSDPDALPETGSKEGRGKLTVFLGAAAGVGKTYTMLETAHERRRAGTDIVIGWAETYGREDTGRLLAGLERIPPRIIEYREKRLDEMDTDAILSRKPEIVLVDELAHTNVMGSRHARRFQDVEEILNAGINVYTTLNIQHLESLNDIVAQITGVVVRETVPDHILEDADSIQLVDIPPEDLLERLKEGKVYVPEQADRALKKFFRPGNINALRELALRYTARQVDKNLSDYMREQRIEGPWPAAGRVMVCVSASPFSTQLIRAAHRLAGGLQADWLAVHVETARRIPSTAEERDRVAYNMKLAEELGAKTISLHADNIVDELLETARTHNVTAIVVGKPGHSRLVELFRGSVVDKLIRRSGGINVYVIQAAKEKEKRPAIVTRSSIERPDWRQYGASLLMVLAVTVVGLVLIERIETINIALLYQLPVTMSAYWWGRWPSYFTALTSVLLFDFLFIPPILTFTVDDIRYAWSFITFLIVAFVIGGRTELLRNEAALARKRERSTAALYKFSKGIAAVVDLETVVRELAVQAADTLGRKFLVLLPNDEGRLVVWAELEPGSEWPEEGLSRAPLADSNEAAVATWAFEHRKVAGRSTETLAGANYLYLPLSTRDNTVGVIGLHIVEKLISPEHRQLMEAWAGLAAMAIERVILAEKAREAALFVESDKLRTALFNSISHELRTPLASIMGAASTLLESETIYSANDRRELMETVRDGANRMDRVIANLLDTARLESGMMKLKNEWCDIEDIVGTALRRMRSSLSNRTITVNSPPALPLVRGDSVLLEQVMINLVDNANKYSPGGKPIEIAVTAETGRIMVSVSDRGVGIPAEDLPKVFDKFYRVQHRAIRASGTGLGLSICKGIIEAHGGEIWVNNRAGGGTTLTFSLPSHSGESR